MIVSSLKVTVPSPVQSPLNIFFSILPKEGASSVAGSVSGQPNGVKAADEKTTGVASKAMAAKPIGGQAQTMPAERILIPVGFDLIQLDEREPSRLVKLAFGRWRLIIPAGRLYNIFEGILYDRKAHGAGHCCFANKYFYKGGWKNGKFYGQGVLINPSGEVLEGYFNPEKNESFFHPQKVIIAGPMLR